MLEKRPTFFIKKNSTLPMLKYPITEWLMEKFDVSEDMLEDCAVTFSNLKSKARIKNAHADNKIIERKLGVAGTNIAESNYR